MEGVTPDLAQEAMRLAAHKLGLKTKFVMRHTVVAATAAKAAAAK
jgi:large subunit ribosomal protein L16